MRLENAGTAFVRKYLSNDKFRVDIQSLRVKFGIPEEGFETSEQFRVWEVPNDENGEPRGDEFDQDLYRIAENNLPFESVELLFGFVGCPTEMVNILRIDSRQSISVWVKKRKSDELFLSLAIGVNATRDEVVRYVRSNWKNISKEKEGLIGYRKKQPSNNENLMLLQIYRWKKEGKSNKQIADSLKEKPWNKRYSYQDIPKIRAKLLKGFR